MGASNTTPTLSGSFDDKDADIPEWAVNRRGEYQEMKIKGAKSFVLKNEERFNQYEREIKNFGMFMSYIICII